MKVSFLALMKFGVLGEREMGTPPNDEHAKLGIEKQWILKNQPRDTGMGITEWPVLYTEGQGDP